jgi:hypothetical protein
MCDTKSINTTSFHKIHSHLCVMPIYNICPIITLILKREKNGFLYIKVRVKQSHYRPWQALRVPEGWGSQISRQSAPEGGKVVSPTHRLSLPPETIPGGHFVRGWVDSRAIVRLKGLCQWKIPITPSGIEPSTFEFVA